MLPCVTIGTPYLVHSFGMEYRGAIGQGLRPYDVLCTINNFFNLLIFAA